MHLSFLINNRVNGSTSLVTQGPENSLAFYSQCPDDEGIFLDWRNNLWPVCSGLINSTQQNEQMWMVKHVSLSGAVYLVWFENVGSHAFSSMSLSDSIISFCMHSAACMVSMPFSISNIFQNRLYFKYFLLWSFQGHRNLHITGTNFHLRESDHHNCRPVNFRQFARQVA